LASDCLKISEVRVAPQAALNSAFMLQNTSAIEGSFSKVGSLFYDKFRRKAFFHKYTEAGIDDDEKLTKEKQKKYKRRQR
jgi:hypothetical protein